MQRIGNIWNVGLDVVCHETDRQRNNLIAAPSWQPRTPNRLRDFTDLDRMRIHVASSNTATGQLKSGVNTTGGHQMERFGTTLSSRASRIEHLGNSLGLEDSCFGKQPGTIRAGLIVERYLRWKDEE